MRKKIIGGIISLLLVGGMLFSMAAPANASTVSIADSSTATFMVTSAAEILNMSPFALMLKIYEFKTSGQNITSIIEESGMTIDEFISGMKEKIAARLAEVQENNPAEGMNKRLSGFISSRNNLSQIFLMQLYGKMQNRKLAIEAIQNALKSKIANLFTSISGRLSGRN